MFYNRWSRIQKKRLGNLHFFKIHLTLAFWIESSKRFLFTHQKKLLYITCFKWIYIILHVFLAPTLAHKWGIAIGSFSSFTLDLDRVQLSLFGCGGQKRLPLAGQVRHIQVASRAAEFAKSVYQKNNGNHQWKWVDLDFLSHLLQNLWVSLKPKGSLQKDTIPLGLKPNLHHPSTAKNCPRLQTSHGQAFGRRGAWEWPPALGVGLGLAASATGQMRSRASASHVWHRSWRGLFVWNPVNPGMFSLRQDETSQNQRENNVPNQPTWAALPTFLLYHFPPRWNTFNAFLFSR